MKLTANDRITALTLFPKQESLAKMKIFNSDKKKIGLNEEELKLYVDPSGVKLTKAGMEEEVEIDISATTQTELKSALEQLAKSKKIEDMHLSLCEKFEITE